MWTRRSQQLAPNADHAVISCFIYALICCICSLNVCCASPSVRHDSGKEDSKRLADVRAPFERCFDTTCNRITHYCDEVIQTCVSCEDDCHPSRITGDDLATKDCQKRCDWYYYLKSLPPAASELASVSTTEESKKQDKDAMPSVSCNYAFMTIMVVAACFTILILVLLGTFLCCYKRLALRPHGGAENKRNSSSPIYRSPKLQHPSHLTNSKGADNRATSIKLLATDDGIKTSQQESIRRSSPDQSMNLSSSRTSHSKNFANSGCLPRNSSTQPLV